MTSFTARNLTSGTSELNANAPQTQIGKTTVQAGRCPSGEGWRKSVDRAWQVLRYYRWSQLVHRGSRVVLNRLLPRQSVPVFGESELTSTLRADADLRTVAQWRLERHRRSGGVARAREALEGKFRFLNVARQVSDPIDWRPAEYSDLPHLWRFHLQYHEFLLDLAAMGVDTADEGVFGKAWDLVLGWIVQHELPVAVAAEDAWHPYCISKRLQSWILFWQIAPPPPAAQLRILGGLASQASYLRNHLEWDLRGNHVLENLRALVFAGAFFDTPRARRWLKAASRYLLREFDEQILPHGEHFERSPGYHAQMLELVLDVRDATKTVDPTLSETCARVACQMAKFLKEILQPGGRIPLLGDTSLADTPLPQLLLARSQGRSDGPSEGPPETPTFLQRQQPASVIGDYWTFRDGEESLLFDAGPVGANCLPAHAHADLLNIEVSAAGVPFIVDSGVYDYEDSAMRGYCRSTAAHNTLEVDGFDQCDMWSRFRMGYRGWPQSFAFGQQEGFYWVRATHNAYRRRGVPVVGRWIACRPGGPWFCVDWAEGCGRHRLKSSLHLHPDVQVMHLSDKAIQLDHKVTSRHLEYLSSGNTTLGTGWYCPEFGLRLPSTVILREIETELPACLAWTLAPVGRRGDASLDVSDPRNPRLDSIPLK